MQLPGEMRVEIFSWVFSSTRITFGEVSIGGRSAINPTINKSKPHALALLYTCRQIYSETRSLWKEWVLFNFQTPEAMLDILYPLPENILSRIRHVRTSGRPILLTLLEDDEYYRIVTATKLLPALRLNTFTVLAGSANQYAGGTPEFRYDSIDELIKYGNGWKELRYIAPNSTMLGFAALSAWGRDYIRKPQPRDWNEIIHKRDGADSGASVTIYRSIVAEPGAIIDSHCREVYQQDIPTENIEFGQKEVKELMSVEKDREMMIVVKRGWNACIAETRTPPYDQNYDIRAWSENMTWEEIRKEHTDGYDPAEELYWDMYKGYGAVFDTVGMAPDAAPDRCGQNAENINWDDITIPLANELLS